MGRDRRCLAGVAAPCGRRTAPCRATDGRLDVGAWSDWRPFALTDHTGERRTDRDFRGKLLVVYFGYTYCPDICPTDLLAISQAVDVLGAAGEVVQPIFISVDPERDTVEHLADYVAALHSRLVGLTG